MPRETDVLKIEFIKYNTEYKLNLIEKYSGFSERTINKKKMKSSRFLKFEMTSRQTWTRPNDD